MHYRISDTGIGMSEEFTKEVFEEFAQEDSDVRTQYHGAGLGMAIVKKYVDMMGGTISVQSKKHEEPLLLWIFLWKLLIRNVISQT